MQKSIFFFSNFPALFFFYIKEFFCFFFYYYWWLKSNTDVQVSPLVTHFRCRYWPRWLGPFVRVNSDPAAVGVTSATSPDRSMSWHRQLGETFDRTCTTNCVCAQYTYIYIYWGLLLVVIVQLRMAVVSSNRLYTIKRKTLNPETLINSKELLIRIGLRGKTFVSRRFRNTLPQVMDNVCVTRWLL